jgi:ABC-2 type transport system ATP-binding protein
MSLAITASDLVKTYPKGKVKALDELSLEVAEGTVLGVLGPNGAGKTTCVRVLSTLLKPDSGSATVAGVDVIKNPDQVRKLIGLSGQYAAVDETLTGWDNLVMFGRLYHLSNSQAKIRATELLEQFQLTDSAKRAITTYSGGMRRRLDLAAALIVRPKVLFLDEPTTGLDPRGRLDMWDAIKDLVAGGTTLLLTTQYLEEADQLADRIAVIDHGKVIANGTSDELKAQVGGEKIEVTVAPASLLATKAALELITSHEAQIDEQFNRISIAVAGGSAALSDVVRALDGRSIEILDLALKRPSLDDVFLALTGHVAEIEEEAEVKPKGRRR